MRCAQCRGELPSSQHPTIALDAQLVAGVRSGYIVVHFCSPWCTWKAGAYFGSCVSTGHAVTYEADSFEQFTGQVPS